MNDYQMSFLVSDRRRELQAEADRARLARSAERRMAGRPGDGPRSTMPRLRLGALIGRLSA